MLFIFSSYSVLLLYFVLYIVYMLGISCQSTYNVTLCLYGCGLR